VACVLWLHRVVRFLLHGLTTEAVSNAEIKKIVTQHTESDMAALACNHLSSSIDRAIEETSLGA
jgi:hypothetical protein